MIDSFSQMIIVFVKDNALTLLISARKIQRNLNLLISFMCEWFKTFITLSHQFVIVFNFTDGPILNGNNTFPNPVITHMPRQFLFFWRSLSICHTSLRFCVPPDLSWISVAPFYSPSYCLHVINLRPFSLRANILLLRFNLLTVLS